MQFKNIKYLAKGKRSKVYTAIYKNKKVIIKYSHRALIEAKWLKYLSKLKFTPKLIFAKENKIVYYYIDGYRILDYLKKTNSPKKIIKQILLQCYELDKLKINKKELTNPYKHILIKNKKARMIDFERCYKTKNPKNTTQFAQFLMSKKVESALKQELITNKTEFKKYLKIYKKAQNKKNFEKILKLI